MTSWGSEDQTDGVIDRLGGPEQPAYAHGPAASARRRYRWVGVGVAGVVTAGMVTAVAVSRDGSNPGRSATGAPGTLVPSNSRALTAAVLRHLPASVGIVWSSGTDGLGRAVPGVPRGMAPSLVSMLLLRANGHQYLLSVATSPGQDPGTGTPATIVPHRNKAGQLESELLYHSGSGGTLVLMETAGPGGAGQLPVSASVLQQIARDPAVGARTTSAMLVRVRHLDNYQMKPPALTWNPI